MGGSGYTDEFSERAPWTVINKKYSDQKNPVLEGDSPKYCQGSKYFWQLIM